MDTIHRLLDARWEAFGEPKQVAYARRQDGAMSGIALTERRPAVETFLGALSGRASVMEPTDRQRGSRRAFESTITAT